jgi:hypothetical protein
MNGCHGTHTGNNHLGVYKIKHLVHAFQFVVTNHPHSQGYQNKCRT